ncbi:MAG: TlyA family RNA methyltransferase, partial [Lachnospiraceae bacterium]|nr:TlyA family RNA methyltransferase [Lachnospiraceae bacterium]
MKKRLDVLLCEQNPELTRSKAQTIIMSGVVFVNNQKELKCGTMFPEDVTVEIRGETQKYVSRGGLKLEKAMAEFPIDLNGKVCMDIGSSTG